MKQLKKFEMPFADWNRVRDKQKLFWKLLDEVIRRFFSQSINQSFKPQNSKV
jgi:hypothetical protein